MGEETNIANQFSYGRSQIKEIGEYVKVTIKQAKQLPDIEGVDKGEVIANVTIAYRHLEDAAMRLGKAIQAYEGGKSIYDNNDAKRIADMGPVGPGTYSTSSEIGSE